jgi:hypothetical protein
MNKGQQASEIRQRDIGQLRSVLKTLCNFVWNGRLEAGEHLWSIPANPERDFDIILSDAIDELEEQRQALATLQQETAQHIEKLKVQVLTDMCYDQQQRLAKAEQETARLREYVQHKGECHKTIVAELMVNSHPDIDYPEANCTCGLDTLLADPPAREPVN